MIRKRGNRFFEKIMLKQKGVVMIQSNWIITSNMQLQFARAQGTIVP
jgi:hypothetical protein